MNVDLRLGDSRRVLDELDANSIDSCVTDPPYALTSGKKGGTGPASQNVASPAGRSRITTGFMGNAWDNGDTAFDPAFWVEVLRVLKPGSHVLAFGGTRTYHRLACAIEDAGFEIRDQIGWVYGSGFPKSHNQHGDWEGWGTALKPAWEPIVMARKPLVGTVAGNLAEWGVGALNVDGCRVEGAPWTAHRATGLGSVKFFTEGETPIIDKAPHDLGRWPANLIHDGSDEVLAAFPQARGQIADASSSSETRKNQNVYGEMRRGRGDEASADSGSAARFFYCAKASKKDRDDGLKGEEQPIVTFATANGTSGKPSSISAGRNTAYKNTHPTVKPTDLMRYLCRLVTPPNGTVLDPFMGSGSTGRGAVLEGFSFIGIEAESKYLKIAQARIAASRQVWRHV
jgi:site-specific DNA-methyltransferase (adenine-specific)